MKLKSTEVRKTRLELLERQGHECAICKLPCTAEQAVLDHDHASGRIRAVLHRGCNAAEGKVANALRRYGIRDEEAFLLGLIEYRRTHATDRTGLVHPSHRTAEEKAERRRLRAKRARARARAERLAEKEQQ